MSSGFKSNLDKQILGKFKFLEKVAPKISDRVIKRFVTDIAIEFREGTPVSDNDFPYIEKGKLKDAWYIKQLGLGKYEIGNPEEYIMIVEYGLNKLSDDPVKKHKSLRFLFANGVFTPDYSYTPNEQVKKEGWIRLVIARWQPTLIKLAKRYIYELTYGAYKHGKLGDRNDEEYRTFLK